MPVVFLFFNLHSSHKSTARALFPEALQKILQGVRIFLQCLRIHLAPKRRFRTHRSGARHPIRKASGRLPQLFKKD